MMRSRRLIFGVGILAAAGVAWLWGGSKGVFSDQESHSFQIEQTMRSMQNHCLGRFVVPLPQGSSVAVATSVVESPFAYRGKMSREAFQRLLEERWRTLQGKTHDSNNRPYASPSTRTDLTEDAVIFSSEHIRLDFGGPGFEGEEMGQTEGYLWRDGHMFHFTPRRNSARHIASAMSALQVREFDAMPTQKGLCAAGSFFADPRAGDPGEAVRFAIDIPAAPPMLLNVETVTLLSPEQQAGLKPRKPDFLFGHGDDFQGKPLRDSKREVADLPGTEHISAITAKEGRGYQTTVSAQWYFPGEVGGGAARPHVTMTLEVAYTSQEAPAKWADFPDADESGRSPQAKFMGLWEALLEGTRLR